jgi:hypothetical protein
MTLWHVSENPKIGLFEPRFPPSPNTGVDYPVVWAVDDFHLVNYLLPRECPRVTYYATPSSSEAECAVLFTQENVSQVVAIEETWRERAQHTPLWLYEFPEEDFYCVDKTAGYYVSRFPVKSIARHYVANGLDELLRRPIELRVVSNLWPLVNAVVDSSLAFSCIRMRNAIPVAD